MLISPDFSDFKNRFTEKLRHMLSSAELGGFILVLANSMQDESLRKMPGDDIDVAYSELKKTQG